jgi:predicted transcriptional regulator
MKITKTITLDQEMADRIQELADRERRSFAREAQVLLETALSGMGWHKPPESRGGRGGKG